MILFSFLTGIWHRYDGVAYFPGALAESVLSRVKEFFGLGHFTARFHQDAIAAAKEFLPSAEDIHKASLSLATNGQTMEGYLEKVVQVMSSLRFQMLDASQQYVDESLVLKVRQLHFSLILCPSLPAPVFQMSSFLCLILSVSQFIDIKLYISMHQCLSLPASVCLLSLFLFVCCSSVSLCLFISVFISVCLCLPFSLSSVWPFFACLPL